jgi:uncharacterized membrane protein YbhN (UPF0104 family)
VYLIRYNLTVLAALPILMSTSSVVGALLFFRLMYYLLPLAAAGTFAVLEACRAKRKTIKEENMTLYAAGG